MERYYGEETRNILEGIKRVRDSVRLHDFDEQEELAEPIDNEAST